MYRMRYISQNPPKRKPDHAEDSATDPGDQGLPARGIRDSAAWRRGSQALYRDKPSAGRTEECIGTHQLR